jgi:hypothetical protein
MIAFSELSLRSGRFGSFGRADKGLGAKWDSVAIKYRYKPAFIACKGVRWTLVR